MSINIFKTAATVVFISTACATPALAQEVPTKRLSPSIGLTHTSLKIKLNDLPDVTWKTDAIGVNATLPLTNNLWLEGKLLKGTGSKSVNNSRIELDHYYGASLVGRLPIITTGFSLYGSVGAGKTKLTASGPGVRVSESDSSLSYGFGLMYATGPLSLRLGYENLYSDDGLEIDGMNVGGSYQF